MSEANEPHTHDHTETFDGDLFNPELYASADPLAGTTAANGKPIWSAQQAAEYLFRAQAGFGTGPNMVIPTSGNLNVINYGFHESQKTLFDNGYVYRETDGKLYAIASQYNAFQPFTAAQRDATREAMTYWDDVMAPSFVETHVNDADIALGNYTNRPGTQAFAYVNQKSITGIPFYDVQIADIGGDVWVAANQPSNFFLDEGGYGMNTLVHEIGHGFGMLHPGNYNASPGVALSYTANAEYYQDTRSYSILSYWNPRDIGARDYDFSIMNLAYGATPMVHDILAVQLRYGADMTTRTGDTTYGFNSNAGRDAFDFVKTPAPMMTIWDAGGIDTLDASGYKTNQVIDLNPGALSSIGGITADEFPTIQQVNANRAAAGMPPVSQANYDANRAVFMTNPALYGRIQDNVGIAYGATIENAVGGGGNDTMLGNTVDNSLKGMGGNDLIVAGLGNDRLDGGLGNDEMLGGFGNDVYVVGESADIVTELANEGTDTVESSISYTLGANLENLTLTGIAANGTGNGLDNVIAGNASDNVLDGGLGADSMIGGAGNDLYVVDNGADSVTEAAGEGTDTVKSSVSYTLAANLENLTLTGTAANGTGNALNNVITGNASDNVLDGGLGADSMIGGAGNDLYFVDNGGDQVTELSGGGNDTVSSSIAYTLGDNVENLILTGSAGDGTGNAGDNVLTGNGLSNRLNGGAGNDRLIGGDGVDYLTGGAGNDVFVGEINATKVASKSGPISLDVVLDFTKGDKIDLSGIDANTGIAGDQAFTLVNSANPKNAGELSIRHFGNMNAAEAALGMDLDGVDGDSPFSGPVSVVFGDVDGGGADFAMVFVNTPQLTIADFMM
ncbi:MAG TPA: M10 family metallopeptidase C-terminal domain-containing protein [Allosphingosinicella sp.]|jgi:serralysin